MRRGGIATGRVRGHAEVGQRRTARLAVLDHQVDRVRQQGAAPAPRRWPADRTNGGAARTSAGSPGRPAAGGGCRRWPWRAPWPQVSPRVLGRDAARHNGQTPGVYPGGAGVPAASGVPRCWATSSRRRTRTAGSAGQVAAGQQRVGRRLGVDPDQLRVRLRHAQRPTEGGEHGLAGAVAEQVLATGPQDGVRAGGLGRWRTDQLGQSAQHRDRSAAQLALDQVGGRGQLVGQGHRGHRELVAVVVDLPGVRRQHPDPGRPDRVVGLAEAPGPARGVGDDHADVAADGLAESGGQPLGGGVRVDGQQQDPAGLDVGGVDSGRGQGEAGVGPDDPHRTALRDHGPGRLGDGRLAVGGVGVPVLGLADDLGRDHDDVARLQRTVVAVDHPQDLGDQVGGRGDLAEAPGAKRRTIRPGGP